MRRNLELIRGQTLTFAGVLRDSSGVVDLTSATLTWRIGTADGWEKKLSLSESDGITVTDATGGAWSITVDPADTSSIEPGFYIHQGEAAIGSAVYNFTFGRFRIRKDIPT